MRPAAVVEISIGADDSVPVELPDRGVIVSEDRVKAWSNARSGLYPTTQAARNLRGQNLDFGKETVEVHWINPDVRHRVARELFF